MAGWKLRKEKTQAETPDSEPETPVEPTTRLHGEETASAPAMDVGMPPAAMAVEHTAEHMPATAPDFETGDALHFVDENEDGPLKLIDYSVPFTEHFLPLSSASDSLIIAAPPPDMPETHAPDVGTPEVHPTHAAEMPPAEMTPAETPMPVTSPAETTSAEMPTPATPSFDISTPEHGGSGGDFTSTLRMSREELASAFAPPLGGIPVVAPFVLDAPLVSPATEEMPPRLVVRLGRLSAAFDLVKEVTVIGRPDSEMHYYPDVEIDMDDAVSRRHAEVIKRDDSFSLVDTGSTNGTMLNGETLPPHEERLLTHGDRIRVGERTEIIFE